MRKGKIIRLSAILLLLITINYAFVNYRSGEIEVITTTEFQDVVLEINKLSKQYKTDDILIVLDIDNTILTSSIDLGGDIWYEWQRGKLKIKPTKDQIVDCLFEDAIGLLFELGTMDLTDSIIPGIINQWQEKGVSVFALTSRSPKYRTATERELNRKEIDFSKTAIRPEGEELPVYRCQLEREMSYMQGIMMTTGMNKGEMLDYILHKTGCEFKHIVFVDDSQKNVFNMEQHFKNTSTDMTIFHYNKIIEQRKVDNGGLVLTKEQAEKMDADWKELSKTLNIIFPGRYNNGKCLNSN